jgi:hypothetical protein
VDYRDGEAQPHHRPVTGRLRVVSITAGLLHFTLEAANNILGFALDYVDI